MGNHERMFLNALDDPSSYVLWVQNGGNYDQVGEIEREHKEWIRELPLYMTIADTLFIHAGIYPGHDPAESIAEGRGDALLWIRQPFLTYEPEFEGWNPRLKKVVHGHTPTIFEEPPQDYIPVVAGQRVNIDTGAYSKPRGRLTAYNVTQNTFHQFSR
jgi:serine/threonine protein phosphatase 1